MKAPNRYRAPRAQLYVSNPQSRRRDSPPRVDFARVTAAALGQAEAVVRGLLPDGKREGTEWVCRNPLRHDRSTGSFKVSLTKGAWADFATGDHGKDLVSLAAFVTGKTQAQAAIALAEVLGVDPFR